MEWHPKPLVDELLLEHEKELKRLKEKERSDMCDKAVVLFGYGQENLNALHRMIDESYREWEGQFP